VLGFVLAIVSTIIYVGAIHAGVQGVNNSLNAVHNITYKASCLRASVTCLAREHVHQGV
jgi:hypothetical protein